MGGPTAWEWMTYFGLPAILEAIIVSVGVYLGVRFGPKKVLSESGLGSEISEQEALWR